jgi:hypothetical protein
MEGTVGSTSLISSNEEGAAEEGGNLREEEHVAALIRF